MVVVGVYFDFSVLCMQYNVTCDLSIRTNFSDKAGNSIELQVSPSSQHREAKREAGTVFCDTTVASLRTFEPSQGQLPNWEGTQVFIGII